MHTVYDCHDEIKRGNLQAIIGLFINNLGGIKRRVFYDFDKGFVHFKPVYASPPLLRHFSDTCRKRRMVMDFRKDRWYFQCRC